MKKTIFAIISCLVLAQTAFAETVCKIDDPEDATRCWKGTTIFYKPSFWSSLDKPLEFAAKYCDIKQRIYWTKDTLLCVSAGKKMIQDKTEEDSDKKEFDLSDFK